MENNGRGKYFAKEDNIRKIFVDLNDLKNREGVDINIAPFLEEFEKIGKEVGDRNIDDEESFPFLLYCSRLDYLEKDINDKFGPFYIAHLYAQKVRGLLDNMTEDNYHDIDNECEKLIFSLIAIESKDDKDNVYDEGIKVLYDALLNESVLEKTTILSRIKNSNNDRIRESLGSLIKKDLNTFDERDLLNIKIKYISKGLGYDYLDEEIIKEIALKFMKDKSEEYQERKKSAATYLLEKADELASARENIKKEKTRNKKEIRVSRGKLAISLVKLASFSAVPIILLSGFGFLGSKVGRKVKNTIKVFNTRTNTQVGETENVYSYNDTPYEIIIKKYSPWREKLTNDGYMRDVLTFKYTSKAPMDIHNISPNELFGAVELYDLSTESKLELNEGDSMVDQEILIRETVVDKDDSIPNEISIVGFVFLGLIACFFLDVGLDSIGYEYFETLQDLVNKLKENSSDLKKALNGKITRKLIKKRYEQIGKNVVEFNSIYEQKVQEFGDLIKGTDFAQIEAVKKYEKR